MKVLLIEEDEKTLETLETLFRESGCEVLRCETEPWDCLLKNRPDIAVIDVERGGWDLCKKLKNSPDTSSTRVILLSEREEVGDRIQAYRIGAEGMVPKPIDRSGFSSVIKGIIDKSVKADHLTSHEEGVKGMLRDMSLVDLLQVLNMGNKTALVYLAKGDEEGKVFVQNGNVVHAFCANYEGEDALYYLLRWKDGRFDVEPEVPSPHKSIDLPMEGLLLEGMRRMDENGRDAESSVETGAPLDDDPESFTLIKRLHELGILEKEG